MRLKKIATYEKANAYLTDSYLDDHNRRYAVTPREKTDFHQAPGGLDLDQVFCLEEERKVSNDWVVQYEKRWLQIGGEQKRPVAAGSTVVVREHRNGGLTLLGSGVVLRWHELTERPMAHEPARQRRVVTRPKPTPDHPWRKSLNATQGQ